MASDTERWISVQVMLHKIELVEVHIKALPCAFANELAIHYDFLTLL
jgi:hypothetical protein